MPRKAVKNSNFYSNRQFYRQRVISKKYQLSGPTFTTINNYKIEPFRKLGKYIKEQS